MKNERLYETLVFLLKLIALSIPLYIMMYAGYLLMPLKGVTAFFVVSILGLIDHNVTAAGNIISAGNLTFIISEDCTGWKSMLFLLALIFATPRIDKRKKIMGVIFGEFVVFVGNIARIIAVVLIHHNFGYEAMKMAHDYLWQAGLISLVLVTWLAWIYFSIKNSRKTKPSSRKRRR